MRERSEQILRITCLLLGALLLVQLVRLVLNINPLGHPRIPALPTLSLAADASSGGKGTNPVSASDPLKKSTNLMTRESTASNSPAGSAAMKPSTNLVSEKPIRDGTTNIVQQVARIARSEA